MPWIKFFEGSIVMLFEKVYFVSLLFVFSAGEFYEVGCFVNVIGVTFNNTIRTIIEKIQEVLVNVIDVRLKATVIINFSHHGKTFMQGVLNAVFPERWEHHAHAF